MKGAGAVTLGIRQTIFRVDSSRVVYSRREKVLVDPGGASMRISRIFSSLIFSALFFIGTSQAYESTEFGYNRPGPAFDTIRLPSRPWNNAYILCRDFCAANKRCKSWTYEQRGNEHPICSLKDVVNVRSTDRNPNFVSGVMNTGPQQFTVWVGGEYTPVALPRNLEQRNQVAMCQDLCSTTNGCRAWTFVRPGGVVERLSVDSFWPRRYAARDGFRDSMRTDERDELRDGYREGYRDRPRDGFRDGPRDGRRDSYRDGPRDGIRADFRDDFRDRPGDGVPIPPGSVLTPDGKVVTTSGTVLTPGSIPPGPDVLVVRADKSVVIPLGSMLRSDGAVLMREGGVLKPDGTYVGPDGTVVKPTIITEQQAQAAAERILAEKALDDSSVCRLYTSVPKLEATNVCCVSGTYEQGIGPRPQQFPGWRRGPVARGYLYSSGPYPYPYSTPSVSEVASPYTSGPYPYPYR
jgi:hypothetical protein